jgi:hypothetical protein
MNAVCTQAQNSGNFPKVGILVLIFFPPNLHVYFPSTSLRQKRNWEKTRFEKSLVLKTKTNPSVAISNEYIDYNNCVLLQ